LHISLDQREANFVPMDDDTSWYIASSSLVFIGVEMSSIMFRRRG